MAGINGLSTIEANLCAIERQCMTMREAITKQYSGAAAPVTTSITAANTAIITATTAITTAIAALS